VVTTLPFVSACYLYANFPGFAELCHCGVLLSPLGLACIILWRLGETVRHKHMESQHCGCSNCSQCLHYGSTMKSCDEHDGIPHCHLLCDLALCMGITVLVSFKMTSKLACFMFILQLLLQAGDIETNPGPTCKLSAYTIE
jgi:hypothetical protein